MKKKMKNTGFRDVIKTSMSIALAFAFLMPPIVSADIRGEEPAIPPTIYSIYFEPEVGAREDTLFITWMVSDDTGVSDVRINMSVPGGYMINESVSGYGCQGNFCYYDYSLDPPLNAGTYYFFIWARDTSGNTNTSDLYHIIILGPSGIMERVHVDDSNTEGPWDGTLLHPFQYIRHGLSAAEILSCDMVFVHAGVYYEDLFIENQVNLVGENKENTIIDGSGRDHVVQVAADHVTITNFTIRNSAPGYSGVAFGGPANAVSNTTITHCVIRDTSNGLLLVNSKDNIIYHNNFINNILHVNIQGSSTATWSDPISRTGNYWDNYRERYPDAPINTTTGTWKTPYVVGTNNIDNHPWVYPSGVIDEEPPVVTLMSPNGGENLSGEVSIRWTATDDFTTNLDGRIFIEYSANNGSTWVPPTSGCRNTGTYLWDTTKVTNGNRYLIRISAVDEFSNTGSDVSSTVFTTYNAPTTPPQPKLIINASASVLEGTSFQVTVTADGVPVENVILGFSGSIYHTNSSGKATLTAVSVEEDTTYSITAQKDGYQSDTKVITVMNKEPTAQEGWVYGRVSNTSGEPIQGAKVCVILPDSNTSITMKCGFTDEQGNYHISVAIGTYTVTTGKYGYEPSTQLNILVAENKPTEVNFALNENHTQPPPNETRNVIDEAIQNGQVGGEITFRTENNIIHYETSIYINQMGLGVETIGRRNISLVVSAEEGTNGTTIVFTIDQGVFDPGMLKILFDGEEILQADSLLDVLSASDDNGNAEWYVVNEDTNQIVFVSIPHFSTHEITIYSLAEVVEAIGGITALVLYIAICFIGVVAFVYPVFAGTFRLGKKKKR